MTDVDFVEFRDAVHSTVQEKHKTILSAWCEEAKVKTPVGYYLDYTDGTYYVYTDRPGYLIGKGGSLVSKYLQLLHNRFSAVKSVKFVEIKGGFANYVAK